VSVLVAAVGAQRLAVLFIYDDGDIGTVGKGAGQDQVPAALKIIYAVSCHLVHSR